MELVVVIGISSIILMSMMTTIGIMYSLRSEQTLVFSRNEVAARIRMGALTAGTLENSAIVTNALGESGITPAVGTPQVFTRFDRLLKCHPAFTDPGQTGCDKSDMDDPNRGNFVYLSDRNSTNPHETLAGEYIHYDTNGARCTQEEAQSSSACPIFARAWAEPFCLNFAATCNKAMSILVRYAVGVRDDYTGVANRRPATLEGEVIVPLQKGIQITRVLDQDNNPLIPNARGIYGVQKYYGYPDQAGSPRALRFEVLVGNPTGLQSIKVQMRAVTGADAKGVNDLTVPTKLNDLSWNDVPNPDNTAQPWVMSLASASQNQLFNFGTINTIKGYVIGARYDLPNTDANKQNYLYHLDASGTAMVAPLRFRSGVYQFRIVALDTGGNLVESTNYATVRIFSRPQMYLSSSTTIPSPLSRNCANDDSKLNLTILTADDEDLRSASYTIVDAGGATVASDSTSMSGTTGSFAIEIDKSRGAGSYLLKHFASNWSSGLVVRNIPLPETSVSNLPATINLSEVVPVTDLISNPSKVRTGSTAVATFSFTTGNCCTQTPALNWTFPNVPEVGNVPMLAVDTAPGALSCSAVAGGLRHCKGDTAIRGILEGPAIAAPNISVEMDFGGNTLAACQASSTATVKYFPVIRIPGIQFYSPESMWVDLPAGSAGAVKTANRKVRIKADFPPADDPVTVAVQKVDGTPVCSNITFPAGTTVDPVIQDCAIPAGHSGDLILTRISPNIKTSADAAAPQWRATLVDGKLQHRVCDVDLDKIGGPFPSVYTAPVTLPMLNSPWGVDAFGNQMPNNDAGTWGAGSAHTLRCWDNWAAFNSASNQQDGFFSIDTYNETRVFLNHKNNYLGVSFPTFVFPYNGGSSPDFSSQNVPFLFSVTRGTPTNVDYRFSVTGAASASESLSHPWTDITASYCNGSSSMTNLKLAVNQFRGFDTTTQTMKAVNYLRNGRAVGTHYGYTFVCTYGNYTPAGGP